MNSFVTKSLAATAVALAMTATGASAGSFGKLAKSDASHHSTQVHAVHYTQDGRGHKRYHRHMHDGVNVEAPFTSVETRHHRHVAVDAPFTSVRVHRRGVWVRAPFVNLFVPL